MEPARRALPLRGVQGPAQPGGGGAVPVVTAATAAGDDRGRRDDVISHYVALEIEARKCADLDALRFAIVNSTRRIAGYEQAFLAEPASDGAWRVTRASGVARIDANMPLLRTLSAWLGHPQHADLLCRGEPRRFELEGELAGWGLGGEAIFAGQGFWQPIVGRDGRLLAALLALKREAWRPQEIVLLAPLAGAYAHAWEALLPKVALALTKRARLPARRLLPALLGLAAGLALFTPVPMSALAPAEVVAAEPVIVTAPIDGVVEDIPVAAGSWVEAGTPILKLVDVKLRNELEVARRNLSVAEARHFKAVQSATSAQKDMQDLATARAEVDVARAELAYAAESLERTVVRAQTAGVLIYAAKSDWLGKPVATGERIMEIGDPKHTQVRIELPVSDSIVIEEGNAVALFLDGNPLWPIAARISRTSYRPVVSSDQQLVFRVHARFEESRSHRIGLHGMARVSGETVGLWFYLLRRPIASIRQRIGL